MKKEIVISVTILSLLCLCGVSGYIIYDGANKPDIVESASAESYTTWADDIIINEESVRVGMTFNSYFEFNKTNKTVTLKDAGYEYSSSDGNADIYFSDIEITSKCSEAFLCIPAKCTVNLTFKCNGMPVAMKMYHNSNGKGHS